jgi:hypothetical protein
VPQRWRPAAQSTSGSSTSGRRGTTT